MRDLNPRPSRCDRAALPTALIARSRGRLYYNWRTRRGVDCRALRDASCKSVPAGCRRSFASRCRQDAGAPLSAGAGRMPALLCQPVPAVCRRSFASRCRQDAGAPLSAGAGRMPVLLCQSVPAGCRRSFASRRTSSVRINPTCIPPAKLNNDVTSQSHPLSAS